MLLEAGVRPQRTNCWPPTAAPGAILVRPRLRDARTQPPVGPVRASASPGWRAASRFALDGSASPFRAQAPAQWSSPAARTSARTAPPRASRSSKSRPLPSKTPAPKPSKPKNTTGHTPADQSTAAPAQPWIVQALETFAPASASSRMARGGAAFRVDSRGTRRQTAARARVVEARALARDNAKNRNGYSVLPPRALRDGSSEGHRPVRHD